MSSRTRSARWQVAKCSACSLPRGCWQDDALQRNQAGGAARVPAAAIRSATATARAQALRVGCLGGDAPLGIVLASVCRCPVSASVGRVPVREAHSSVCRRVSSPFLYNIPDTWLTLTASDTLTRRNKRSHGRLRPSHGQAKAAGPTAHARRCWWVQQSSKTIKALLSSGCPGRDKRREFVTWSSCCLSGK